MSAFFSFLHFIAAFALVAALVAELVLLRQAISVPVVRQLLVADAVYGASAALVLAAGLLRVFYFEKGAAYYFGNAAFLAKLGLFILVGCLSIYPTKQFFAWRRATRAGKAPEVNGKTLRALRATIQAELIALILLVLCATLMAHGLGSLR